MVVKLSPIRCDGANVIQLDSEFVKVSSSFTNQLDSTNFVLKTQNLCRMLKQKQRKIVC
jgi:hypothetical protein